VAGIAQERDVRVVLGEGEPGFLRLVLESQGFDVIGHARGDDELRLVLAVTEPTVVVLDAGISAAAALEARSLVEGVPIVAVWPAGVAAVVAEERVEPGSAIRDLGDAVRRAVTRGHGEDEVLRVPDLGEVRGARPILEREPITPSPLATGPRPRRRNLLVAAAAWALSLTALATIGLAVPRAFDLFERHRSPRPSFVERPSRPPEMDIERQERTVGIGSQPVDRGNGRACGRRDRAAGTDRERGKPEDPGHGCGTGESTRGRANGRPADPGSRGQGNGPDERPEKPEKAPEKAKDKKDRMEEAEEEPAPPGNGGGGNGAGGNGSGKAVGHAS
jgi:hypothetical protein